MICDILLEMDRKIAMPNEELARIAIEKLWTMINDNRLKGLTPYQAARKIGHGEASAKIVEKIGMVQMCFLVRNCSSIFQPILQKSLPKTANEHMNDIFYTPNRHN